jgi:hypothetical protein
MASSLSSRVDDHDLRQAGRDGVREEPPGKVGRDGHEDAADARCGEGDQHDLDRRLHNHGHDFARRQTERRKSVGVTIHHCVGFGEGQAAAILDKPFGARLDPRLLRQDLSDETVARIGEVIAMHE